MGLLKSLDGGDTWTVHKVGEKEGSAEAVAIDCANDNVIYIGGSIGALGSDPALFKSVDGGTTWTSISGAISDNITALAVDPVTAARIYAGTATGIFRSEDGGLSWDKRTDYGAVSLKVNPLKPGEVYAGGSAGLYVSYDSGDTWASMNAGLLISQISSLDLNPEAGIIYAGTLGGGVCKRNESGVRALIVRVDAGGTTIPPPGTYYYSQGQSVDIEAVPDRLFDFEGWTGSLAGSEKRLTVVMNSDTAVKAGFSRRILAPLQFAGLKKINRSLLTGRYINILTWQSNPDNVEIAGYRIYWVNGAAISLLAEVSADTFEYWHRNVKKDQAYRYGVCAVNQQGREGEFSYVDVR